MRPFIDPVTGAQFTTTLPGAQDACTCNAATGMLNLCNRPECTTASAVPTCPNGVTAQCSNYDSTIELLTNTPTPVCSTLGAPRTHLNAAITLPTLAAGQGQCDASMWIFVIVTRKAACASDLSTKSFCTEAPHDSNEWGGACI